MMFRRGLKKYIYIYIAVYFSIFACIVSCPRLCGVQINKIKKKAPKQYKKINLKKIKQKNNNHASGVWDSAGGGGLQVLQIFVHCTLMYIAPQSFLFPGFVKTTASIFFVFIPYEPSHTKYCTWNVRIALLAKLLC